MRQIKHLTKTEKLLDILRQKVPLNLMGYFAFDKIKEPLVTWIKIQFEKTIEYPLEKNDPSLLTAYSLYLNKHGDPKTAKQISFIAYNLAPNAYYLFNYATILQKHFNQEFIDLIVENPGMINMNYSWLTRLGAMYHFPLKKDHEDLHHFIISFFQAEAFNKNLEIQELISYEIIQWNSIENYPQIQKIMIGILEELKNIDFSEINPSETIELLLALCGLSMSIGIISEDKILTLLYSMPENFPNHFIAEEVQTIPLNVQEGIAYAQEKGWLDEHKS